MLKNKGCEGNPLAKTALTYSANSIAELQQMLTNIRECACDKAKGDGLPLKAVEKRIAKHDEKFKKLKGLVGTLKQLGKKS